MTKSNHKVSAFHIDTLYDSGASQAIKQLLPNRIALYRGLSKTEAKLLRSLREKISSLSDNEALFEIRAAFSNDREIFTSSSRKVAGMWSQKFVPDGLKKLW